MVDQQSLARSEGRKTSYKKGLDANEGRRRRDDTRIKLRKDKREEGVQKRRAMSRMNSTSSADSVATVATASTTNTIGTTATNIINIGNDVIIENQPSDQKNQYTADDIPHLFEVLTSNAVSTEVLIDAIRGFRRLLSVETNPPVLEIIQCGAVPLFVQLLTRNDNDIIQFEAAWALTNIGSSEYTQAIVDEGAVPHLVALLQCANPDVREQCAWCLGNVAGDSPQLRNVVLNNGAMEPLLRNIAHPGNDSLLQNCVWTLSNLCRGKPQPDLPYLLPAIPHLVQLLKGDIKEVQMDAAWALSYLSDGDDVRIQAVMDSGVCSTLVSLLEHKSASVITPILRTLGNFVSGNDSQTQTVLDCGVLSHIPSLLASPRKNIRKETCWLLSNIAAGTEHQIGAIVGMPTMVLSTVVNFVQTAEWEVRKEATWVLSNIATGGRERHVEALVELGGIDAICSVLDVADMKITLVALDAVEKILEAGLRLGHSYAELVDEAGGLELIEGLQEHQNEDIYEKAISIIEQFFGIEDELEDENVAPMVDGNTFTFGVPTKEGNNDASLMQQQPMMPLQPFNFVASDAGSTAASYNA